MMFAFAGLFSLATATARYPHNCRKTAAPQTATDVPRKIGFLVIPALDPIDVNGPFETIYGLSLRYHVEVVWIAETLNLVSNEFINPAMNKHNGSAWTWFKPTHTFDTAPDDLDVLIVPGGAGARNYMNMNTTISFLQKAYPKLDYFMTICTGAMLAAKAGLLDGRNATTNKLAWNTVTPLGPKTNWFGEARWMVDGNVWTGSGVTAGLDTMAAFIACTYGEDVAWNVTAMQEYSRNKDQFNDPFAVWPNGTYKYYKPNPVPE